MKQRGFTIPEIILIGGTRAALGAGVALLISGKISRDARNTAGWVLLAVGALTTIPSRWASTASPISPNSTLPKGL